MISRLIALLLLTSAALFAEPVATALKPGKSVPDVGLRTDRGDEIKLREIIHNQPAVLIFYRGGWCPYCQTHLQGLAGIEAELQAAGVQLLAISMDQPSKLRETPGRDKLAYRLLSDNEGIAIQAFGIAYTVDAKTMQVLESYHIDIEAASGRKHHLLPHPAVFIVDAEGVVRFSYAETDYKVRLDPATILKAAKEIVAAK